MNHIVAIQGVQTDLKGFRHLPDSDVWKCERCQAVWEGKTTAGVSFQYAVCGCETRPVKVKTAWTSADNPWLRLLAEKRVHVQTHARGFWCEVSIASSNPSTGVITGVRLTPEVSDLSSRVCTRDTFLRKFIEGVFSF